MTLTIEQKKAYWNSVKNSNYQASLRLEGFKMISATIISDSISSVNGKRITTFELNYPRLIHSELMTHRMFSRNASSSRAIPVSKVIEMVRTKPAMPVRFGANQAGMQDKGEEYDAAIFVNAINLSPRMAWQLAAEDAADWAELFAKAGYHKQICNRLTEPFQWMKTLVTATEYHNFFWLRRDEDADPTIKQLADLMFEVLQKSTPFKLHHGEWHVPYVERTRDFSGKIMYVTEGTKENPRSVPDVETDRYMLIHTQEQALAISSSCCAQVSYRKLDSSLEKAEDVYDKLINGSKVHGSPFEHQASPMSEGHADLLYLIPECWDDGVTHMDKDGNYWSGNFMGYIQYRQLIPGNVFKGEVK